MELSFLVGAAPATEQPLQIAAASEPLPGDLADELDAFFDAARQPSDLPVSLPPAGADVVTTTGDLDGIRQLFAEMAVPYMRPVRDFMLELSHTDSSISWLEACEPALEALRATSRQLDMPDLCLAIDGCLELFATAKTVAHERIAGELRAELLARFSRLTELLPEALEVGGGREPLIVQLILLQVPGVHKRTVEKLTRAGVHHLDAFLYGTPDEIAAVADIDLVLATRITEKFRDYASRFRSLITQLEPQEEHAALARLVAQLREQDTAFERARAGWSKEDVLDKRRLRRDRSVTLKEIYVVLIRLGEGERVDLLEKLPVRRQLEELESLASDAARRARTRLPFA
ncbi:MAG: hypothetical protein JW751_17350 [Polyangiaceae bacterium]|nr:hypothetical protein [Polyangiaceae bacterium]